MKLLLFILGITLITAYPTLRGLQSIDLGESGENTEGIFVVFEGLEDVNADLPDNFSFNWNFGNDEPNNGESGESNLEQALEEENIFLPEEEILPDLLTQVRNDPVTNGILDFGVSTVIASGIEKGKIPNITFTVTSISALTTTTNNAGDLYDFSCEAVSQNGNSNSVLDMNFTVYYDFASERKILSAYSFMINTTTVTVTPSQPSKPENGYVQVSEADIETDAVVQDVLEYGIAQIYTIGTQAGNIPASDFVMAKIVSVWKQVTDTGANYRCEVVLDNKNSVTVNANFTVAYVANTQQSTLTSYQYTVSNIIVPTPPINNTNTTTPSQPTNTTTNSTTPVGNNNSTNTTTNTTIDGFTALSADEIQSAPVQAALGYGVNQILQSGYAKGKIPVSQYNIANVSSVLEKIVGKITTYRCAVVISGTNKANISAIFDVFLQNANYSMGGWTYNITTIRNATNPTNSTNTTTPTQTTNTTTNSTVPANTTTPTQPTNTTTNSTGSTNTTTPTQPTNTTNTTTPVGNNNSTNTTTNATTDGFTALSADEIQSAQVQSVLDYGVNQILQNGYAKGKIPVSQYNITSVSSVLEKIAGKRTTYRCAVVISGANKANISASYDVFVQNANYSMGGWTYNITTIRNPTNSTNSTNTTTPTQPTNTTTNSTTPTGPANTTTPTQPANNTNTTTPTQPTNTTTNSTGSTNTTTPTQPTNTTNTTTPVGNNNSTNTTTNATTSGFTALSVAEIRSAQVQAVLAYGTNQLIQSGNAKGKIPVSVYNLTRINSVLKKAEAKSTLYECDVVLQDANNVTVAAVFNVSVNATQGLFVNGWTYTVTNIKKPQNNTNTTNTTAPATSNTATNTTSVNTTDTNTNTANNTTNNTITPAVPITPVATNNSTNTTGTTSN